MPNSDLKTLGFALDKIQMWEKDHLQGSLKGVNKKEWRILHHLKESHPSDNLFTLDAFDAGSFRLPVPPPPKRNLTGRSKFKSKKVKSAEKKPEIDGNLQHLKENRS